MDLIRVIIISIFLFMTISSARAAELTIILWPDENADYVRTIDLVKSNVPNKIMLCLWGWEKLEPEQGDTDALAKETGGGQYAVTLGMNEGQYFGVTVIDTVKRVLPSDIKDIAWDDPELLSRYTTIVTRLKNELKNPPNYFVIANEVDVYLNDHPDEIAAFLKFAASAQKTVKDIFPTAKVGFTVTFEGISKGGTRASVGKQLIDISDMAFLTYYPVIDMKPTLPENTPAQLDLILKVAGSKPVALQEVGYPSNGTESSEATQAKFFETIIPAIQQRPQIKFASIFALHDMDKKTCDSFMSYYGFSGLFGMSQQAKDFQGFLCSLGLRHADGSPKPAWDAVVNAFSQNWAWGNTKTSNPSSNK